MVVKYPQTIGISMDKMMDMLEEDDDVQNVYSNWQQ